MGQKRMEKRLKQYAAACENILPEKKEERIRELLQTGQGFRTRGNLWDFIIEQMGYLGRYCLFWQALWAVCFCYLMRHGIPWFIDITGNGNGKGVFVMISLLPPLLVLLTVEEVTKVYQRSMLEIEYAAKYSLRSAVMVRMLALCVFHSMVLAVCIVCLHSRLDAAMGKLFVYGFTPMILVTGGLLKLMQFYQGEVLRSASVSLYLLMAVLAIIGSTGYFQWYQPDCFRVWCVMCMIGILFVIRQFICLNDKLASFERIVR